MTSTRSSLEVLQELYPVLVSLPPPRFTNSPTEIIISTDTDTDTDMEKKIPQHAPSLTTRGEPTSNSSNLLLLTLAYITPPLMILYAVLLGYTYNCPFITDTLQALAQMTNTSPDRLLAAALLVSSAGLITLGVGFLWAGELAAGDERI